MLICLYSLLLVIRFEGNQRKFDPFIRFEADKYLLLYSLIFASKRISGTPYPDTITRGPGTGAPVLHTTFWIYLCFINIYSLQLYSLHIIFACLYLLLLVIRFGANQSESDPFIRFEVNKYSLRYSLILASKWISGTPYAAGEVAWSCFHPGLRYSVGSIDSCFKRT
jgi:hypothetical protein